MKTQINFSAHKIDIISSILNQNKFPVTDQSKDYLMLANFRIIENNDSVLDNTALPILLNIIKHLDVNNYVQQLNDIYFETIRRLENLENTDFNWIFQICLTWVSKIQSINYQMSEKSIMTFIHLFYKYKDKVPDAIIDKLIPRSCAWLTINGNHEESLRLLSQVQLEIK